MSSAPAPGTAELVATLRRLGIELAADGDLLRYRAPQGVLTPELRARLAASKAAILEHLRGDGGGAPAPLGATGREGALPLSFAQERFWMLHRLEPDSPAYQTALAVRLRGPLDLRALERSLAEIVRRHEILRTAYRVQNGEPTQVIGPPAAVPLPVVELPAGSPSPEGDRGLPALLAAEAGRPFDLGRGPLLRALVVRAGPDDHVLLLTAHLVVMDGWSLAVLLRELGALYGAFRAGAPSPLPEPSLQYADFAAWQRRSLRPARLEEQLRYWRSQLAGVPATLPLPADRPRPAGRLQRARTRSFALEPETSAAVRHLGRAEGATPFATLLAALQTLLARRAGVDDVVVATVVSTRPAHETEEMLGSFANQLLLRTRFPADLTFRALLGRVQETVAGALAHQDLPFEHLVRGLPGEDGGGTLPETPVVLVFHGADPLRQLSLPGLSLTPLPVDTGWTKPDLQLTAWAQDDQLGGALQFSTDRFEPGTVDRLLGELEETLRAMAARPESRLDGARPRAARPVADPRDRVGGAAGPGRGPGSPAAAPAAALEQAIARVWGSVLRRDHVPLQDNFFDLGGRSVQLLQVCGQLERLLGREVPLLALFEHPTVRALARHLAATAPAPPSGGPAGDGVGASRHGAADP